MEMEETLVPGYSPSVSHHHGSSGLFLHAHHLPNSEGFMHSPVPLVSCRGQLVSVDPCQV
uniref:Proannomuricatin HI n=1 Tax=Annona muricata TaxID=13337 RepID=A0A5B9T622_ANNMU|nr:proannomuricatin HI [Annona muricata]